MSLNEKLQPSDADVLQQESFLKVDTSKTKEPSRVFDNLFDHLNSFGKYQKILYFCINISFAIPIAGQFDALVFAFGTPAFQCSTANFTCSPRKCCEGCTSYAFDENTFTSTASEWNLICDNAYLSATLQSCFFVGMLIGSFLTGMVSDAWGRKKCMFINYAIMTVSGIGSALVNSIALFGFLRFVVGFSLVGVMLAQYIYMIELVGPSMRTAAGTIPYFIGGVIQMLVILTAYLIREWRVYLLVVTAPAVLVFPFWKLIPESPRWLIAHNHLDEAHKDLMRFGGKDGKLVDSQQLRTLIKEILEDQTARKNVDKKYTIIDLFRTPKLRKRMTIMCLQWFLVALVNFGIWLFVTQLAGNLYVNVTIMAAVNTLKVPLVWLIFLKCGRRIGHGGFFIMAGITLLLVLPLYKRYPMATTVLAILGKIWAQSNWTGVYIITPELFPTVLRNTAQGIGSMSARVGGILAPFMAMLSQLPGVGVELPAAIFGVFALIAGIVMYWIPETLFAPMHQTIEEAEAAEDDYSIPFCGKPLTPRHERALLRETGNHVGKDEGIEITL